ncbi:MAG TPA: hypothetical protein VMW48_01815, partial [Vicinamibacterales bacterium]|nr:hypothetical protein [Vicinamibacterales bacterium]
ATWTTTAGAPRFTLAVPLHSVRVVHRGAGGPRTWLDVLEILPGVHASVARRVTRYGDLLVYSMDDASHVEPDGLWTGGDRAAELLLASASGRPVEAVVDYVAGPAAVTVAITGTAAATPRALAPHERRSVIVAVASDRRPTRLLVTVGGGFRAHERGGPATDDRWLGVRLSFPQR